MTLWMGGGRGASWRVTCSRSNTSSLRLDGATRGACKPKENKVIWNYALRKIPIISNGIISLSKWTYCNRCYVKLEPWPQWIREQASSQADFLRERGRQELLLMERAVLVFGASSHNRCHSPDWTVSTNILRQDMKSPMKNSYNQNGAVQTLECANPVTIKWSRSFCPCSHTCPPHPTLRLVWPTPPCRHLSVRCTLAASAVSLRGPRSARKSPPTVDQHWINRNS